MKKVVVVLFCVLTVISCGQQTVEKPDHLIEKDKMIAILYDIALLQAAENTEGPKFVQEGIVPSAMIYKKYGIDSVSFAQSNRYYASDPHNYKKMYGEVFHRLEEKTKELNGESLKTSGKAISPSDTPAIQ